jgi:hypothetical protein
MVLVLSSPFFTEYHSEVVQAARTYRLPTMFIFKSYVEEGGLMSYGVDQTPMYRRIATYVAQSRAVSTATRHDASHLVHEPSQIPPSGSPRFAAASNCGVIATSPKLLSCTTLRSQLVARMPQVHKLGGCHDYR